MNNSFNLEPSSIINILNYYKVEIYNNTCRFFGVPHFSNSVDQRFPQIESYKCDLNAEIDLISFITKKLIENKENQGILDIYTENIFWNGEKNEVNNIMRDKYDMAYYDPLYQLYFYFYNCFYGNKESDDFKNSCIFHLKNDGQINSRFHYLDIRNNDIKYIEAELMSFIKKYIYDEINLESLNSLENIVKGISNYINRIFNDTPCEKFLNFEDFICDDNIKNYKFKNEQNKISKQINKIKNTEIYSYLTDYLDKQIKNGFNLIEICREKINLGERITGNARNNISSLAGFIICLDMDLYFYGRFFSNLLNGKSANVIVVAGSGHIKNYMNFIETLPEYLRYKIFYFHSDPGQHCIKLIK